MAAYYEKFNSVLLTIVNMMTADEKADGYVELEQLKNRLRIIIRSNPDLILRDGYKYIRMYKAQIFQIYDEENDAYDWSVFYDHEISQDIINEATKKGVPIHLLFKCVQNAFRNSIEDEKIYIYEHVLELLSIARAYKDSLKSKS